MVIFPWEVDFYKKDGIDVVYFGNPFVEKYPVVETKEIRSFIARK